MNVTDGALVDTTKNEENGKGENVLWAGSGTVDRY
jgi:hypothetical protein